MRSRNSLTNPGVLLALGLLTSLLMAARPAAGQAAASAPGQASQNAPARALLPAAVVPEDYSIGPGDILDVTVQYQPEASGRFRVSDSGYLVLPLLSVPVKAEGLSAIGLSQAIAKALADAELLINPMVTVFVEEYHSRTVTVLGAVAKPSVYPLQKPTTVLEVLSMAGGLLPTAGNKITIAHPGPVSAEPGAPSQDTIDMAQLMAGKDPALNVGVHAGDVISVDLAPIVYVVGAVQKAGGFVVQDPSSGITVLQALALAGGMTGVASPKRTLIIHRSAGGKAKQEEQIDLSRLMTGKQDDQLLAANDILFIPESNTKKSLEKLAQAGMSAVNGIAIYGVGYRVAGIK